MKKKLLEVVKNIVGTCFIIICFALLLVFICNLDLGDRTKNLYPEVAVVTNIIEAQGKYYVEFTVSNGNQFIWISDDGDINVNEYYALMLDDNGTDLVQDDKIERIVYCNENLLKNYLQRG